MPKKPKRPRGRPRRDPKAPLPPTGTDYQRRKKGRVKIETWMLPAERELVRQAAAAVGMNMREYCLWKLLKQKKKKPQSGD